MFVGMDPQLLLQYEPNTTKPMTGGSSSSAMVVHTNAPQNQNIGTGATATGIASSTQLALQRKGVNTRVPTPQWHAPWELSSVISGHLGWVRSIAFDASNEWFATGSADRTIKVSRMNGE